MENKRQGGFTLIEMLVVIAIIALLVSIVIPAVGSNISKAEATTDAANLRSVLGQVNTLLVGGSKIDAAVASSLQTADSIMYPDATTFILYCDTHFVETFYVVGDAYYGIDYFAEMAEFGESDEPVSKPVPPAGSNLVYEWFEAGVGTVPDETP